MRKLAIFFCLAWVVNSCTAPTKPGRFARSGGTEPDIRVLLEDGKASYRIASSDGLIVRTAGGLKILESTGESAVVVKAEDAAMRLTIEPDGSVGAVDGAAIIVPRAKSFLSFNRIRYAGSFTVTPSGNGTVTLVNILPLEQYLEGVLPHEMGNPGPDGYDALKSQAVAARTYAFGKIQNRKDEPFDVYASVQDQVYRGIEGRTKAATAATRDTRGRIAGYRGETIKAYYSACCGGHTSDIREVWPTREPADYLHGVPDRDTRERRAFCRDNRYFRWRYSFTGRELGDILRVTIPRQLLIDEEEVGALKDVRIEERSHSGRVVRLTVETTKDTYVITGDPIRWFLVTDPSQGRILPSVMFRLDKVMERDRIAFVSISGGGNGHGVGMCQNGAIAMAKKGYTYKMILAHYYPGCTVERAY